MFVCLNGLNSSALLGFKVFISFWVKFVDHVSTTTCSTILKVCHNDQKTCLDPLSKKFVHKIPPQQNLGTKFRCKSNSVKALHALNFKTVTWESRKLLSTHCRRLVCELQTDAVLKSYHLINRAAQSIIIMDLRRINDNI